MSRTSVTPFRNQERQHAICCPAQVDLHIPQAWNQEFPTSIEHSRAIPIITIGSLYLCDPVAADDHRHVRLRRSAMRIDDRDVRDDQRRRLRRRSCTVKSNDECNRQNCMSSHWCLPARIGQFVAGLLPLMPSTPMISRCQPFVSEDNIMNPLRTAWTSLKLLCLMAYVVSLAHPAQAQTVNTQVTLSCNDGHSVIFDVDQITLT